MMELRRLRLLHTLSHYGTVAAVAEALRLTTPAVSQQLAVLEKEVGTVLLEREGRKLRLTEAGRLLVAHTEILLDQVAAAEADLVALRTEITGTVKVACFPSAMAALIPLAWKEVVARYGPQLEIRLWESDPSDSLVALRRGEIDIAIAHSYDFLPRDLPPGCERHDLLTDPVMAALPSTAGSSGPQDGDSLEPIPLDTLSNRPWITAPPTTTCFDMVQRACGAAGFVPRVVAHTGDFPAVMSMVAVGMGVALVPRMTVTHIPQGAALHPLIEPFARSVFAATRRSGTRRPAVRAVLEVLKGTQAQGQAQVADTRGRG